MSEAKNLRPQQRDRPIAATPELREETGLDAATIFGDGLRELSERAAYLYRESDRYWFSTQPTLNRVADEGAKDVSTDDADAEITAILRKDQGSREAFTAFTPRRTTPWTLRMRDPLRS